MQSRGLAVFHNEVTIKIVDAKTVHLIASHDDLMQLQQFLLDLGFPAMRLTDRLEIETHHKPLLRALMFYPEHPPEQ